MLLLVGEDDGTVGVDDVCAEIGDATPAGDGVRPANKSALVNEDVVDGIVIGVGV